MHRVRRRRLQINGEKIAWVHEDIKLLYFYKDNIIKAIKKQLRKQPTKEEFIIYRSGSVALEYDTEDETLLTANKYANGEVRDLRKLHIKI